MYIAHGTFPPHLNHDLTPSLRMREAGLSLVQNKVDENRTGKRSSNAGQLIMDQTQKRLAFFLYLS